MTDFPFEKLQGIFHELDDAVVAADPDRRIHYVNPAAERMFGCRAGRLRGRSAETLYATGEDFARLGRERFGAGPARETERYRVYYRRANGEVFASETVTSTLHDDAGGVAGFLGIIRDITGRLAVEAEAAAAARRLEDAIAALDDGFALYDVDDRLVLCNERYRALYPKSVEVIVPGARFRDILLHGIRVGEFATDGLSVEDWLENRLRFHHTPAGQRLEQHLADGRWLQIRERRTRDGGVAGVRTDITALKVAQEQAASAHRKLQTLANNMPCLIEELDAEGRCVFINDVGARWLGTTGAAALGQATGALFGAEQQAAFRPYREAALAGRPSHLETSLDFPDGRTRDVVVDYIPKTDESGAVTGVFVFFVDTSNQKNVERTLHRLHAITSRRDLDLAGKVRLILEAGTAHFSLPYGLLNRLEGRSFVVEDSVGGPGAPEPGLVQPLETTHCATMLAQGSRALALARAGDFPIRATGTVVPTHFESYIGAPVVVDGTPYGALCFVGTEPRAAEFTVSDREIVKQFADWIGREIARERDLEALRRAKAQLEELASTDPLTGVLNRRAFEDVAEREFERTRRYGSTASLLMIDVDHFKAVNDRFGHAEGDRVLKRIAEIVSAQLRPNDAFGRIGGEEFCLIAVRADTHGAHALAERICRRVRDDPGLRASKAEITVSIGIASFQGDDGGYAEAMRRADRALYRAKEQGRNRACNVSGGETAEIPQAASRP